MRTPFSNMKIPAAKKTLLNTPRMKNIIESFRFEWLNEMTLNKIERDTNEQFQELYQRRALRDYEIYRRGTNFNIKITPIQISETINFNIKLR